jgi:tetratricopeptide (TPR) repeat protein
LSFVQKLVSRSRVKEARKQLAKSPSAARYVELANAHAHVDELDEARRVCDEGLELYSGNPELQRIARRVRELQLEDRTRRLSRELREAPRPALYRELCEILLESGRLSRAEECALEWFEATKDGHAQLVRAHARLERFLTDRRREDGRVVLELCDAAEQALPRDPGPLEVRLQLCLRIGAWGEARAMVMRLLELSPGDPMLEARFRALSSVSEGAPTVAKALREVERTGALVDDEAVAAAPAPDSRSIRPKLKGLVALEGVHAAVYERGSTALVQGPKGATAERTARAVRDVVSGSRTAARRLGLGQAFEVVIEGEYGNLVVAPGELGSAALWCTGPVRHVHHQALAELASAEPSRPEAAA